jgi:hypothetical protein
MPDCPRPAGESRIQAGDVFLPPVMRNWAEQKFETNLAGRAWGHMVLVLGPLPYSPHKGYWRIMNASARRDQA